MPDPIPLRTAEDRSKGSTKMFDDATVNDLFGLRGFEAHGKRWLLLSTISRKLRLVLAVEVDETNEPLLPADPKIVVMPATSHEDIDVKA